MKNILHELYLGRVSRRECRINRTAEEMAVEDKIQTEKKHFSETMSAEDYKRLDTLESLYTEAHYFENVRTFVYAFRLGALIMCAILEGEETEK